MTKEYTLTLLENIYGEFAFVRKKRPEWQSGWINLPGGKVEKNLGHKDIFKSAEREILEELGITIKNLWLCGRITGYNGTQNSYVIHCFCSSFFTEEKINPGDSEDEEFFWEHWDYTKENPKIIPNLKIVIPLMINKIRFCCIDEAGPPDTKPYEVKVRLL